MLPCVVHDGVRDGGSGLVVVVELASMGFVVMVVVVAVVVVELASMGFVAVVVAVIVAVVVVGEEAVLAVRLVSVLEART